MKEPDLVWLYKIFGLMLGIFRPSAALEAAVRLEASVRSSIRSQVSVLSSCHFPLTESPGTVFYLTSIKTWALILSPHSSPPPRRAPSSSPPQRLRAKLEEKRIRMGNLPVIPRTAARRAICLINSLFCRSPSGPHPSSRPSVRHPPAREGEKGG